MTESRQSNTPAGGSGGSSQMAGAHVMPMRTLFVLLFPSVTVGSVGCNVHVVPLTKYLYCTGLSNGTLTVTFQSEPTFTIGAPVTHVSGPP
jgi:hypothetical protein